ncbi:MAG: AAA family ATPase [Hahellaceae bacterium]|jgi:type II secretory pathway predicted ATPase ExeA|nr:AAA family ATPase [Hahellaceae bacterium]
MYLEFFGLDKPPFKITPDTQSFYEGCDRGASLSALCYAILHGEGITKVVGEVGSGKTMLCRMLPLKVGDSVDLVYIAHPSLSPEHTLHAIAQELGLTISADADKLSVMRQLHETLVDKYTQGRRVVVLVEEAQGMPLESLEEMRLLSNLETDEHKLMQIVLFGQPELDENLQDHRIRQLRERITHSLYLTPLQKDDVHAYLNFRLRSVGYSGPDLFSPKVAKAISKYSEGLVRRINILADKALLSAYTEDRHTLSVKDVKQAATESSFQKSGFSHAFGGFLPWMSVVFGGIAALVLAFAIIQDSRHGESDKSDAGPKKTVVTVVNGVTQ